MDEEQRYTWRKHRDQEIDWVAEILFWVLALALIGGVVMRIMS